MRRTLLLVALMLGMVGPVSGQSTPRPNPEEVAQTQAQYRDAVIRTRRIEADVAALDRRIAATEASLERQPAAGDEAVVMQRRQLDAAGRLEARALEELALAKGPLTRVLGALQTLTRHPPPPLVVPTQEAVDTVRAAVLMKALVAPLTEQVERADRRRATVVAERRAIALQSERLFVSESQTGDRQATLQSRLVADRARRATLRAEARRARREVTALEARLRAAGAPVPDVPASQTPALRLPNGRDTLLAPVEGPPSVRFGKGSTGWQWQAPGQAVLAPLEAEVIHAGPVDGWGQVVILDAGPGWRVVLSGLTALDIGTGDRVRAGQRLGEGARTLPVVLELRREELAIDPSPWLD
ncbi:MAG: peptidoglycan DD-metalloendopeptidase family protein [Brevundimonas sp.]|uniref:murein hydrolase activator EnvC family protein n=1 Tax=Brevundimonas sp. TaxID=1871086 RepID=UPI0027339B72|nr:peptidoglycan DD-metalloendopeptidase family protein [Brevundimonas sp.]MDP3379908.1 peptidoglycan DD-metalloendopeptidase family protein [Brevundimonas sp.]MDZ4110708.1 peptidoglycan DD-metalloendopeptidase family protein [Brevundimonas sp.]